MSGVVYSGLRGPGRATVTAFRAGCRRAGTELFENVGAVRSERGLDDVVLLGDLLASVPELSGCVVGVGFLVNEGGDGLSE